MQPLAARYPTLRLSPWRQVRKNIHSRVWTPSPTWSVLHLGGPPFLVPLSSYWLGDMGLTPEDWSGLLSRVATPGTTRSCLPPRRASLLVPLPLDLSVSLPPEFCALPFVCFLCGTWHRAFVRKHCQLEDVINNYMIKISIFWQKPWTNPFGKFRFFPRFLKRPFSGLKRIFLSRITKKRSSLSWFAHKTQTIKVRFFDKSHRLAPLENFDFLYFFKTFFFWS